MSSGAALVDLSLIATVVSKSTDQFPVSDPTWSSTTSEICVAAALKACAILNSRLAPFKTAGASWTSVVTAAVAAGTNLAVDATHTKSDGGKYSIYCAALTLVELDVLTGENDVLSVDIFYDCGTSLNPAVLSSSPASHHHHATHALTLTHTYMKEKHTHTHTRST